MGTNEPIMNGVVDRQEGEPGGGGINDPANDHYILSKENYGTDVLNELNALRLQGALTDAVLCADDEEFPCHRNVLAVSSPYFKAMFSNDLKESRQARIVLNDIRAGCLGSIIDYAYTGSLEITVDNAQDMLAAGGLLQYPLIVDACCNFLSKHLHPSNCFGIEHFAHLHSCSKLEIDAHQYVLDNFSSVIEYEEFLQVPVERLQTYLASDLIDVRNEEIVFGAAIRWIQEDLTKRLTHFCSLLEHIRLATIDPAYLDQVVGRHSHIAVCDVCRQRVDEARRLVPGDQPRRGSMQQQHQLLLHPNLDSTKPRPSTMAREMLVVLGGMKQNAVLTAVDMYDTVKDKWIPLPDMPAPVSWFSACVLDNNIYVTGGILDGHIVSRVLRFEPAKRQWCELPPMLSPRARHASAVWNGCLYVIGGINLVVNAQLCAVESIQCYQPKTNTWKEVGHAPMPRKQSHVTAYNNTLVEVGGTKGGAPENTLESYFCNDSSILYSGEQFKLPDCIQFAQIMLLHSVLYIVWEDTKQVILLDPQRRTFRRLKDLHSMHIHGGSTVVGELLYVTGGLCEKKATRTVECYDPVTDCWKIVSHMQQPRACHGCVTINIS